MKLLYYTNIILLYFQIFIISYWDIIAYCNVHIIFFNENISMRKYFIYLYIQILSYPN